jgi:hypothetical protein
MPGNKPPSATPKSARTVTNDAKFDTNPRHMVSMPQTAVSNGSHIFGDIFFSTRFDGSSLNSMSALHLVTLACQNVPRDIRRVKHTQANRILMVIDVYILLETQNFRVADIRPVDEGTEEQERENREDAKSKYCQSNKVSHIGEIMSCCTHRESIFSSTFLVSFVSCSPNPDPASTSPLRFSYISSPVIFSVILTHSNAKLEI